MKYKDLPYIRLNGGEIVDDEEERVWPGIQGQRPPRLIKQASKSCEFLQHIEDASPDMSPIMGNPSSRAGKIGTTSRVSVGADEYVEVRRREPRGEDIKPSIRPSLPIQEITTQRQSGIKSKVYDVIYDYNKTQWDELTLKVGSSVTCLIRDTGENGWYYGQTPDGKNGYFPTTHVRLLGDEPTLVREKEINMPPECLTMSQCEIGSGGFAKVYRVIYRNREVALKQLREEKFIGKNTKEILKKEAILINRLRFENIVGLHGICSEDPFQGLVLEYCKGKSLKQLLTDVIGKRYIPVRTMVNWALQIAKGMEYLSKNNCIHRDLKADNVLVKEEVCDCLLRLTEADQNSPNHNSHSTYNDDGTCTTCRKTAMDKITLKITDFSDTRQIQNSDEYNRQSTHVVGTYSFLAPEVFISQCYSERSDVWSYGVVLWEILTKQAPYANLGPRIAAYFVATKGSSLEVNGDCPMKWKEIMWKCWEKFPNDRPNFSEIVADFQDYKDQLQADGVSDEEEMRVQAATREINDLVQSLNNETNEADEIENYHKVYRELCTAIESAWKPHEEKKQEITQKPQPRAKKKIQKNQIGRPDNLQTIMRMVPMPDKPNHFNVVLGNNEVHEVSLTNGTLPRVPKRDLSESSSHNTLRSTLSASSPNLNNINNVLLDMPEGRSTLKRHNAIKKRPGISGIIPANTDEVPNQYANIEYADPPPAALEALTTPVRRATPAASIDSHHSPRRSEDKEPSTSLSQKVMKLFKLKSRGSEDRDSPAHIPSSARSSISSTGSKNHLVGLTTMTRGPIAPSFHAFESSHRPRATSMATEDEHLYAGMPPQIVRNKVSPAEHSKISPNALPVRPHAKSATNLHEIGIVHRNLAIDDTVPSQADYEVGDPRKIVTHNRTPSDSAVAINSALPSPHAPSMSPPNERAPLHGNILSSVVPPPSLPNIPRRPPGESNAYVRCSPSPSKTVMNGPYRKMPSTPQPPPAVNAHAPVTNSQYFHCTRPRPDSLPLKSAQTPESSGISTGGSSFSTASAHDQVPLMHAPAPPRPPTIPPREGTVHL